jgi:hypothetical protein
MLQLTFLVIARSMPLVAHKRLRALPLASLIRLLLSSLNEGFEEGTFLRAFTTQNASLSVSPYASTCSLNLCILSQADHPGAQKIHALSRSMLLTNMSSLSRMCSQLLAILADNRPDEVWSVLEEMHDVFIQMSKTVQSDWLKTPFSRITKEDELGKEDLTHKHATDWSLYRTPSSGGGNRDMAHSQNHAVYYDPLNPISAQRSGLHASAPSCLPLLAGSFSIAVLVVLAHDTICIRS